MAEKHIFIGLGGSGVNTVATVKYKIYEKLAATAQNSRLDLLNADYRFLFVDTDAEAIIRNNNYYSTRYENGKVDFIDPENELIDLGNQNPKQIYIEASKNKNIRMNKRIVEACDDFTAAMIPNEVLRRGASAFRIKSRIAFAQKDISEKLSTCISDLNSLSEGATGQNDLYYWIVCSSSGGTGSGIVNDVLYHVNMLHKQLVNPADPYVVLVMYMPQYYIDRNRNQPNYPINAHAVFSEIEAFQCMSKERMEDLPVDFHRLALLRDYHQFDTNQSYRPFNYCIPIDYQTDKDTNLGSDQNMYYNTAEMLYYIHGGAGGEVFRSGADNYLFDIQIRSPKSFLIPMGYIALRKPVKDFEDYMNLRMKYELLRYGIIGEKIQTNAEYKAITDAFYNNLIDNSLFKGADSAFFKFKSVVDNYLEENLPDSLILNSEGKPATKLPAHISNTDAERIFQEIKHIINRKQDAKEIMLKEIESNLWKWVEENVEQHGLEYVDMCLSALDIKCTETYNNFTLDRQNANAQRKVLQNNIDALASSLDDLYKNAIEETKVEWLTGKNKEDVEAYFSQLKQYVQKKAELLIMELVYDMVKELSVGDQGIIDRIKRYAANMLAEAQKLLNKEDGAKEVYNNLAKAFMDKERDVTSVYLPEIHDFVNAYGWKENHKFSTWYSKIVLPTNNYEQGKGFIPVRSGKNKGSLEFLMREIVHVNKEILKEKGYVNAAGDSTFFSSGKHDSIGKTLEDYMTFASGTFEKLYQKNTEIQEQWISKSLASFFDELDREKRKKIKARLNPCMFFTYNQSRISNTTAMMNVYIAENQRLAEDVFSFNASDPNSRFAKVDIPSTVYMIKAKLGLSFEDYRTYEVIKREYDNTPQKQVFHFHAAFAGYNGVDKRIELEKEFEPEFISFVRYMLMDGYRDILTDCYHSSTDNFDKNNYSNTPFVMEKTKALIAKGSNISQRGENICLNIRDGADFILYASLDFGDAINPYILVYEQFKRAYVSNQFESAINGLIKKMTLIKRNLMEEKYATVRKVLMSRLDANISNLQNRGEVRIVTEILKVLKNELDTFDKFLPR